MKRNEEYSSFDMFGFAQELAELTHYKSAYYEMKKDRDYWKKEYNEVLSRSIRNGEVMTGTC